MNWQEVCANPSLKYYRDFINVLDTAKKDDIELIAEVTGLSKQTLANLKLQYKL